MHLNLLFFFFCSTNQSVFTKILFWNDTAIQELNPGLDLPPAPIVKIYDDSPSGLTLSFTTALSAMRYTALSSNAFAYHIFFLTFFCFSYLSLVRSGHISLVLQISFPRRSCKTTQPTLEQIRFQPFLFCVVCDSVSRICPMPTTNCSLPPSSSPICRTRLETLSMSLLLA